MNDDELAHNLHVKYMFRASNDYVETSICTTFDRVDNRDSWHFLVLHECSQYTNCDAIPTIMETPTASVTPGPSSTALPQAEEQERFSSLALFVVLSLLIGSFWTSYYLKVRKITAVHETIVGLFAGMFVGAALRIGPGEQVQKMLSFSNTIMLNVLLPPIILASGYDLRQVS